MILPTTYITPGILHLIELNTYQEFINFGDHIKAFQRASKL